MAGKPLQLIGRKKCRETQKAERWLKERRIDFHFLDLDVKALSPGELESVAKAVGGFDVLIDVKSSLYEKKGLKFMDFEAKTELAENSGLLKTPILRASPRALLGFDEKAYADFIQGNS